MTTIATAVHPQHATVLYDGHCRFCSIQIAMLRRLDWGGRLSFRSFHDPDVGRDFPEIPPESLERQMYVVSPQGRAWGGAEAVRYLSRQLVPLWPLAVLLHVPGSLPLWTRLYAWVARNRFSIAGSCNDGTCRLP